LSLTGVPLGSRDVIGTGMRSPFSFSVGKGVRAVTTANGLDKIISSIQTILRTRPGERIMQPEFGCVSGDTKIPLLNGTERLIRELVGVPVWVYGNRDGKMVPAFSPGAVSRGFQEVLRVTLDNMESILVTAGHPFMLRGGMYCSAENLLTGMSLMPLYRKINRKGYEETYLSHLNKWCPTHRVVLNVKVGHIVHHKDFCKRNNSPDNLVALEKKEHIELHAQHIKHMFTPGMPLERLWKDPKHREKMRAIALKNLAAYRRSAHSEERRISKMKASLAERWKIMRERREMLRLEEYARRHSPERQRLAHEHRVEVCRRVGQSGVWSRSLLGRAYARTLGLVRKKPISAEVIRKFSTTLRVENRTEVVQRVCSHFKISRATLIRRIPVALLAPQILKGNKWHNHKVLFVEKTGLVLEVFDLANSTTENYAVSAGVFIHNSRLYDLVFEPSDGFTNQLLYYYTVESLRRWERRITITNVYFQRDDNRPEYIGIVINFYVVQTHQTGSFVFPFEIKGMSMTSSVTGFESNRISTKGMVLPIQGRP